MTSLSEKLFLLKMKCILRNFFEFQFIYFNFWQQFYLLVIQQLNWDLKILKWILGDAHPCCRAVELFFQWLLVLCDDQWLFYKSFSDQS